MGMMEQYYTYSALKISTVIRGDHQVFLDKIHFIPSYVLS